MLSSLYDNWIAQLLTGPIPEEAKATCDDCAMLPRSGAASTAIFFHPKTRCCTYEPELVNYRAGMILMDETPELAPGRRSVEERLRTRIAVTPWGVHTSARFRLLYRNNPDGFGRASELGCPHQIDGQCGIWRHRPATCSTWFCKYNRGATGFEFWRDLGELLREADQQMGLWCALEMGTELQPLGRLLDSSKQMHSSELGGDIDEAAYRKLWGRWAGRETEFYRGCASLVEPLDWNDVTRICGPRLRILSQIVRERHEKLVSEDIPERPRMGLIQIEGLVAGKYNVVSYNAYDPIRMPPELVGALAHFDGRPVGEVLEEIRVRRGVRLAPALVRRMTDFRILVDDGG